MLQKRQDDEAASQQRLRSAQEEIQAISAKHDKLAADLVIR